MTERLAPAPAATDRRRHACAVDAERVEHEAVLRALSSAAPKMRTAPSPRPPRGDDAPGRRQLRGAEGGAARRRGSRCARTPSARRSKLPPPGCSRYASSMLDAGTGTSVHTRAGCRVAIATPESQRRRRPWASQRSAGSSPSSSHPRFPVRTPSRPRLPRAADRHEARDRRRRSAPGASGAPDQSASPPRCASHRAGRYERRPASSCASSFASASKNRGWSAAGRFERADPAGIGSGAGAGTAASLTGGRSFATGAAAGGARHAPGRRRAPRTRASFATWEAPDILASTHVSRRRLARAFPGIRTSADAADRVAYARDLWPRHHLAVRAGNVAEHRPAGIVWPANTGDVSAIVKVGLRDGTPVVPFGAGSGVCAGVLPSGT